jgi:GH35 family endo-1,4-beta-xylanase
MGIPSTSEANLLEQARNYRVVTDIVLNNDNCPTMIVWGIKDNDSWRSSSNPLLYTAGLAKKKAWYAVRSALRHRTLQQQSSVRTIIEEPQDKRPFVYDLSGRLLSAEALRPGLYIKNGKIILKN